MRDIINLVVLAGDGIGPEVTAQAVRVLQAALADGPRLVINEASFGGHGLDTAGDPFPAETEKQVRAADAVLLGAVGGPAWDDVESEKRPEAGLLRLRRYLDVFANLRPVVVGTADVGASPLRKEVATGVDLLIVRELTSGIYFGEPRWTRNDLDDPTALDSMVYTKSQVERIARIAFEQARQRGGKVTSVDKANVLASSRLWRSVVIEIQRAEYSDVELAHLYVDNAAMQLVTKPADFDVILTGNLFGDILSDLAAVLPGSIGVLPSASIGFKHGLFEPVHGSAPDIAGRGIANPVGCILSSAMLLDYLSLPEVASRIRAAVASVRAGGTVTADMSRGGGQAVSTEEFGSMVVERVQRIHPVPT